MLARSRRVQGVWEGYRRAGVVREVVVENLGGRLWDCFARAESINSRRAAIHKLSKCVSARCKSAWMVHSSFVVYDHRLGAKSQSRCYRLRALSGDARPAFYQPIGCWRRVDDHGSVSVGHFKSDLRRRLQSRSGRERTLKRIELRSATHNTTESLDQRRRYGADSVKDIAACLVSGGMDRRFDDTRLANAYHRAGRWVG